ncbi:MAG: hypothetical protein ACOCRK_08450, partial [bacterium]
MSNPFYNYLSEKLVSFFRTVSLKGGERFYLQFDDKNQVRKFYEVLRDNNTELFEYKHKYGSPYNTYALVLE